MKQQILILCAAILGVAAMPVLAQQKPEAAVVTSSEPGKVGISEVVKVTATVQAIDKAQRQLTLKDAAGKTMVLPVGPEAKNFDQIKVGDQVVVGYLQSLSMTLKKDGKELPGATMAVDGARAASGAKPAGIVGRQVTVVANVIAIDAKTQTLTLKGAKETVNLKVRDPKQFALVKVGDQIEAVYTEALAVSVEPAAKK